MVFSSTSQLIEERLRIDDRGGISIGIFQCVLFALSCQQRAPSPCAITSRGYIRLDNVCLLADLGLIIVQFSVEAQGVPQARVGRVMFIVLHGGIHDESDGLSTDPKLILDDPVNDVEDALLVQLLRVLGHLLGFHDQLGHLE